MTPAGPPAPEGDGLAAFVREVRGALQRGARHQTPGFGTFTTCTRKAAPGRPACTIAMWRASAALRGHAAGDPAPALPGAHQRAVEALITAMVQDGAVDVPGLGRLAVVRAGSKPPRLTFHADPALNASLPTP